MALDPDATLGRGFNTISGLGLNYAIRDRAWSSDPLNHVSTQILQVMSEEDLSEKLSLSVSASFNGFAGAASAKAQFSRESKVHSSSLFALVSCTVHLERRVSKVPQLTDEAEQMLVDGDSDRFLRAFGDVFANELIRGGELHSIVQIETRSEEHRQYAKLEVEAAGSSLSANATVEQAVQHLRKLRTEKISVFRSGATTDLPDYAKLVEYVRTFQADVKQTGGAVLEPPRLVDYGAAALPRGVSKAPNLYTKYDILKQLAALARTIRERRNSIAYIQAAPSIFLNVNSDELQAKDKKLVAMELEVAKQGTELIRDPVSFDPKVPAVDPDSILPLPTHQSHYNLPLEVIVRRAQGVATGKEADWVGSGLSGLTQQISVRFALPESELSVECEVCYLHRGGPVLPYGEFQRVSVASDPLPFFEHGIKGIRMWLEGARKSHYDIYYGVEMTPDGHREEAANGKTIGQWDSDLKQYHHQICSLRVLIQSRL